MATAMVVVSWEAVVAEDELDAQVVVEVWEDHREAGLWIEHLHRPKRMAVEEAVQ
jgi:hypothetical protein